MKPQDPKYEFIGGIRNRHTGEMIPLDEPVFLFRARDKRAVKNLARYGLDCSNPGHQAAVAARLQDFQQFAAEHPERMKEPDTPA